MSTPEVLVSAIRERLDEIERKARAAATRPDIPRWRIGKTQTLGSPVVLDDDATPTVVIETFAERYEDVNDHIVLHDPSSVPRRVQADRRVLERHAPISHLEDGRPICAFCSHASYDTNDHGIRTLYGHSQVVAVYPCPNVRDLADGLGIDLPEDTDG